MGERELLKLVSEMSNGIWRANNKLKSSYHDKDNNDIRLSIKHLESVITILEKAGFEIKDHNGELFDIGMALNVLTFQPMPDIEKDTIIETIKPTIYYNDAIIQRGQVIVAKPE